MPKDIYVCESNKEAIYETEYSRMDQVKFIEDSL